MLISIDYINKTEGYRMGENEPFEPFTDNIKRLFQSLQKECGKCVSKVYIDNMNGKSMPVGWVFEKLQDYTDCNKKYLQETWVTLHQSKPTKSIEYHYQSL